MCEIELQWMGSNRCALSSVFLMRPRPDEMHAILAGTRKASGLVLVLRSCLFQAQTCTCCEGTTKVWRRIVSVVWATSWLLLHTGEVGEVRGVLPWQKKILWEICERLLAKGIT